MSIVENKIRKALECPVDWSFAWDWGQSFEHFGRLDWFYCCLSQAVSIGESVVITTMADDEEIDPNVSDLVGIQINLCQRRSAATRMYSDRGGRAGLTNFLQPSKAQRGKHFVPGLTRPEAVDRSANGPSLFFTDHYPLTLKRAFWGWACEFFSPGDILEGVMSPLDAYQNMIAASGSAFDHPRAVLMRGLVEGKGGRIAFDTGVAVGASKGREATCVCFDVKPNESHAFPLLVDEAETMMGIANVTINDSLW